MSQLLLAALVTILVFVVIVVLARRFDDSGRGNKHSKRLLSQLSEEYDSTQSLQTEPDSILRADMDGSARMLLSLPFGQKAYELILKSGMGDKTGPLLLSCVGLFLVLLVLLSGMVSGLTAFVLACLLSIMLPRFYLRRRIKKRNDAFINQFPDAVDMIVRSVKSGHPLNTALRMIAENMEPPMRTEFKQLVDEIAFGRSTVEALSRMAQRIDEPDLQFFVVILSVQQETGGNLAEVLSNLSNIIRKRKQLRLKIKALTSEGRATAYILGSLPFFVFGAIHVTSPDYLVPLFTTDSGNMILGSALCLVALAAFIVYNMLQIDI